MNTNRFTAEMSKPERNLIDHFRSGLAGLMALALMSTWSLGAEVKMTLLKVGPRTYRRVTVLGVSETDLYFRHANGISNVKLRNLSRELQAQFGYNAQAAEEAERRQMAEDSAYYETVAARSRSTAKSSTSLHRRLANASVRSARPEGTMNIEMTARHLDLTPELRAYAEEKIAKLGRLVHDLDIQVTLSAEKHRQQVSIVANGKGATYTADLEDDDLHRAIGEAVDVLARQIRKDKTAKLSDRREGADTIRRRNGTS